MQWKGNLLHATIFSASILIFGFDVDLPSDKDLERADSVLGKLRSGPSPARKLPAGRSSRGGFSPRNAAVDKRFSNPASSAGASLASLSPPGSQHKPAESSPDVSEDEAAVSALHNLQSNGAGTSDIYQKFRQDHHWVSSPSLNTSKTAECLQIVPASICPDFHISVLISCQKAMSSVGQVSIKQARGVEFKKTEAVYSMVGHMHWAWTGGVSEDWNRQPTFIPQVSIMKPGWPWVKLRWLRLSQKWPIRRLQSWLSWKVTRESLFGSWTFTGFTFQRQMLLLITGICQSHLFICDFANRSIS